MGGGTPIFRKCPILCASQDNPSKTPTSGLRVPASSLKRRFPCPRSGRFQHLVQTCLQQRTYVRTHVRRWRRWRNALGLPEPSLNVSPIPGPKPRPGALSEPKPGPKPEPKPGPPLQRGSPAAKRPGRTKCAPRFFAIFSICSRKRRPQGG